MWLIWLVFCDCGFHSVCPLMDKDKRLMEASWWEAPWKKSYDQPRQQSKSRDITLPTKVGIFKATVFPVVRYGYESWTIKKAEHWRIDAFKLWCGRRVLRVSWTARRSNQSIPEKISPECSLDWCWSWSSNTLATWCEELTHWNRPWCWERQT